MLHAHINPATVHRLRITAKGQKLHARIMLLLHPRFVTYVHCQALKQASLYVLTKSTVRLLINIFQMLQINFCLL